MQVRVESVYETITLNWWLGINRHTACYDLFLSVYRFIAFFEFSQEYHILLRLQ